MRRIGNRMTAEPGFWPSADALRSSSIHQHAGIRLAAVVTTGIAKGIYRFASHEEMNRHADEALVRVIAANVRKRSPNIGQR